MARRSCLLIGAPLQSGAAHAGCAMGPAALRTAGLAETISSLGYDVEDLADVTPIARTNISPPNQTVKHLTQTVGWAEALEQAAYKASKNADVAIFMGGDHSLSLGSVPGVARYARQIGRPQFVLWIDAHPDFHNLESTRSGNLHGTPVAYFTGQSGFGAAFPKLAAPVPPGNVCMIGLRSVDGAENTLLTAAGVVVYDMRHLDEHGIVQPLRAFLDRVAKAKGRLHVSFDVDFLDPDIAPGVGTTVPGGATYREAHLIMELLHDSALVTSLDLVELNPFLDERGRTARLMVALSASLMGRKVLNRFCGR